VVIGAERLELFVDRGDLGLELVDHLHRGENPAAPWLGESRRLRSSRPCTPNRSDTGQRCPNASSWAWMRCFSELRLRTKNSRQRARSRSWRCSKDGSQIAGMRSRRDSSASTHASIRSVLHASGASPLDLLRVGDLDLPAAALQRVVHEPGAVHRLDRGAYESFELAASVTRPSVPPREASLMTFRTRTCGFHRIRLKQAGEICRSACPPIRVALGRGSSAGPLTTTERSGVSFVRWLGLIVDVVLLGSPDHVSALSRQTTRVGVRPVGPRSSAGGR
jgi:hypothetical protein